MARHYLFVYFMKDAPDRIREVVPYHVDYWKGCRLERYLGGPFVDRTGGLIRFDAESLAEATALVEQDPFVVHRLVKETWIKEWMPELQQLI